MITIRVAVIGSAKTGKTELCRKLLNPENLMSATYSETLGFELHKLAVQSPNMIEEVNIGLWDLGGHERFYNQTKSVITKAKIAMCCIDLSVALDDTALVEIQKFIDSFPNRNHLILVGTKHDAALPDAMFHIQQKLNMPKTPFIATSAKTNDGSKELHEFILQCATKKLAEENKDQEAPNTDPFALNKIIMARNRCFHYIHLYKVLDHLNDTVRHLNSETINTLGEYANQLIDDLLDDKVTDKQAAIAEYIKNSSEQINGKHYYLKGAVLMVASAVAAIVLTAILGFTIGFVVGFCAGAWTGPGAFISALLTGTATATKMAVVAADIAVGVVGGATAGLTFFEPKSELKVIRETGGRIGYECLYKTKPDIKVRTETDEPVVVTLSS